MSADSDYAVGQPAQDQALDWDLSDLPAPEEPGWYAEAQGYPGAHTGTPHSRAHTGTSYSRAHTGTPYPGSHRHPLLPVLTPAPPTPALTPALPTSTIPWTTAHLSVRRSRRAAGLTPSRLTPSWPPWSISSSAMGWTSWMMTS